MARSRALVVLVAVLTAASAVSLALPQRAPAAFAAPQPLAGARLRAMRGPINKPIPVEIPARFRAGLPGTTVPAPTAVPGAESTPAYDVFQAPSGMAIDAAEPSIGVNWNTGNIMFQAYVETTRVSIDESVPPVATWTDVTAPNQVISLDPILFTDPVTGQTAVSQLVSTLYAGIGGCSFSAVTGDDGENWTVSEGCGPPGTNDHQSIGGGPYADPANAGSGYPHSMYYCGQNGFFANCSLSTDGGVTYGAAAPMYTDAGQPQVDSRTPGATCLGLHGHIKVGPDGTAYLPNVACGKVALNNRLQGVVVSEDDGATWEARTVPGAFYNDFKSDPSVAIATDNTVYLSYEEKQGGIRVVVSNDHGRTWTTPFDVGAALGVQQGVFPAAVAGDGDRAAVAFLGTTTKGVAPNFYEASNFTGVWHLYVATTYDRGATWTTVDVTPNDPVQRGCVYWGNGNCPSQQRNLLDFMDAAIDKIGRVVVGYADGCLGPCVGGGANTREDFGAIARQARGRSLFSAYDAMFDPPPAP
jgi:hypothetical protein